MNIENKKELSDLFSSEDDISLKNEEESNDLKTDFSSPILDVTNLKNSSNSSQTSLDSQQDGVVVNKGRKLIPFSLVNTRDRSGRTPIFKYASKGYFY